MQSRDQAQIDRPYHPEKTAHQQPLVRRHQCKVEHRHQRPQLEPGNQEREEAVRQLAVDLLPVVPAQRPERDDVQHRHPCPADDLVDEDFDDGVGDVQFPFFLFSLIILSLVILLIVSLVILLIRAPRKRSLQPLQPEKRQRRQNKRRRGELQQRWDIEVEGFLLSVRHTHSLSLSFRFSAPQLDRP